MTARNSAMVTAMPVSIDLSHLPMLQDTELPKLRALFDPSSKKPASENSKSGATQVYAQENEETKAGDATSTTTQVEIHDDLQDTDSTEGPPAKRIRLGGAAWDISPAEHLANMNRMHGTGGMLP